ncbi:uncharacterized protein BDR25DRAFT_326024 [Lindgomyces ingoldianus]|uniref:Uncharacterized protein n=1 Tax=Lindgomyces ingoldianus TaxID=673940 RepID=A0ACB6QUP0_9PLEO|nr:uncharacterized protein BDR25DRAFT_326024 [Lindgomyces ingoldianus]KAF2469911.1 hypothetical protein BDR25DRAFT_326024 [Lindgomyces ingoldianus]
MADFDAPEFIRYAAVPKHSKGPGDAQPTAMQIVKDNDLEGQEALGEHLEPGKLDLLLDLNSLAFVRSFAADFLEKSHGQLNILINNAGVMATPEGCAFNSRVVCVSSMGHRYNEINFDNLNLEGEYEPNKAYSQSKVANIYMANQTERRYSARSLHGLSLHPGGIWDGSGRQVHVADLAEEWKKTPGGAATTMWAAIGRVWERKGGKYLENCQVPGPVRDGYYFLEDGYETWAYDQAKEERLWKVSCELVGVKCE